MKVIVAFVMLNYKVLPTIISLLIDDKVTGLFYMELTSASFFDGMRICNAIRLLCTRCRFRWWQVRHTRLGRKGISVIGRWMLVLIENGAHALLMYC